MMPATVPEVGVYAGDSLIQGYVIKTGTPPVPQDLSGWTFTATWRVRASDTDGIPLTVDASQASVGAFVISATPAQTRAMGRSGIFDLQGTQGSLVRTFLVARTNWSGDVTRA